MEIRKLYCDVCNRVIDEANLFECRMLRTNEVSRYYFEKNKKYLTSGDVCKKCSKIIDKKIKKLFKEVGFKYEWNETKDE